MRRKVPKLKSDKEVEGFLNQDLTEFIALENFKKVNFEFFQKPNR